MVNRPIGHRDSDSFRIRPTSVTSAADDWAAAGTGPSLISRFTPSDGMLDHQATLPIHHGGTNRQSARLRLGNRPLLDFSAPLMRSGRLGIR